MLRAFVLRGPSAEHSADDALAAAAQADSEEFAVIYERYLPRVYRYLAAKAASPEEAADLTQAVFLKAFISLPKYQRGKAPFASWLFGIARNTAIDAHRRRRGHVSIDAQAEFDPPSEHLPEADMLRFEQLRSLRSLVAGLKPELRELIALRYAGGLTIAEIAPLVGKNPEAVKKQLQRTLKGLKEHHRENE